MEAMIETCVWVQDGDGYWTTTCCNAFEFTDGGPVENGARFCMFCGQLVEEEAAGE